MVLCVSLVFPSHCFNHFWLSSAYCSSNIRVQSRTSWRTWSFSLLPPTLHHLVSPLPDDSPVSPLPSIAKRFKDCLDSLPPSMFSPPTFPFHGNLASVPTSKSNCSCQDHLLGDESQEQFSIFISFVFSPGPDSGAYLLLLRTSFCLCFNSTKLF